MPSLNQLKTTRAVVTGTRRWLVSRRHRVSFEGNARISMSSRFVTDRTGSISVGTETLIAFKTLLISREGKPIRIGRRCFIGGGSMILPGVTIGDGCIVAAGAVVFDDIPPHSIVAGNPARVIRSGIEVGPFGRLPLAAENSRKLWKP
jgi:maltose O-acetyltransferase